MTLVKNITIGSDPEVFLKRGKIFIPSFDLVGGSKNNPRPLGDGFFVQEDNVALEFNIPPVNTRDGFIVAIGEGLKRCKELLPPDIKIEIKPSTFFSKKQLNHYKADVFGCEPDQNAWTGEYNPKPDVPTDGLRCTGGHIHVGFQSDSKKEEVEKSIIKWMDIFLGVPSIFMDNDEDRRRLYGKAGCYRSKKYGVEYRTLSSFWLKHKDVIGWVFDNTLLAVDAVNKGIMPDQEDELMTLAAINAYDKIAAAHLLEKYKVPY